MSYKTETILKRINSDNYEIYKKFQYTNKYYDIIIKKGFITDGATIPRFAWSIVGCPLNGNYVGPSIIHDALYATNLLSRKESDQLFIDLLKEAGVGYIKRKLFYNVLRVFGYTFYNNSDEYIQEQKKFVTIKKLS